MFASARDGLGGGLRETAAVDWPLVGRERQLGSIAELLADSSAGGLVVAGAAGVGKTRVAREAAALAESRGSTVEWVRATASAATIPLGAFATLLPPAAGEAAGAELLARARQALAERVAGGRLVLCVDDGHLLDHGSAALLHQLVAAGEALAVVTVRADAPAPDAVVALWKDELCAFVELHELGRDELERLVGAALGGPVDGRTARELWDLTRGNPLFVRELVRYGIERDLLVSDGGIWRWRGDAAAGIGTRLAEIVEARLEGLDATERSALELVAIGAPLEAALLDDLIPAAASILEALERRELVEVRASGRRRLLDLAHPLHDEAIRARLPATRLDAVRRSLAGAVEATGARRRQDPLRVAAWRLESGSGGDPGLLAAAAERALAGLDWPLAERFARAAVDAGGGFGARLALGRALAGAGRAEEAERVLGDVEPLASTDPERAAVVTAIARNLFWGLTRAADAEAALRRGEEAVADADLRDELTALRVRLVAAGGEPVEALAAAEPLLRDSGSSDRARLHAAVATAEGLAMQGRVEGALAVVDEWLPVARAHRDDLPLLEPTLLTERALALRLAGRLIEATEAAQAAYDADLPRRSAQNTGLGAGTLGYVWLARGRVRTALRWLRESVALLRDADAVGMLSWALAGLAQAAAQAGEPEEASEAAADMEGRPIGHRGMEIELGLGRAWAAAAEGELSKARALAREAADLATSRGQSAYATRALYELARLGEPEDPKRLARAVHGPFAPAAAAHAAALAARDGAALLDAAERFAALDMLLSAAEAADAAAAAHRDAGREASARSAELRAAALLAQCEDARPPTLAGPPVAAELTDREREIAMLAAGGLTSREIAERLVVSVRTVDNHLQRAYRKLGISRRGDLTQALTR
jgi:DNA-binding NarL/FixJ family response regulator